MTFFYTLKISKKWFLNLESIFLNFKDQYKSISKFIKHLASILLNLKHQFKSNSKLRKNFVKF